MAGPEVCRLCFFVWAALSSPAVKDYKGIQTPETFAERKGLTSPIVLVPCRVAGSDCSAARSLVRKLAAHQQARESACSGEQGRPPGNREKGTLAKNGTHEY